MAQKPWRPKKNSSNYGASPYAYGEYPQLEGLTESDIRTLILAARLSPTDAQIALGRLVWRAKWADIGAATSMNRTTCRRRLRSYIVPRLTAFAITKEKAGA